MADTDVKMQERGVLIGATKNNELVLADIDIRLNSWGNGGDDKDYTFSVSFDVVRPFNAETFDTEGYWRDNIDSLDNDTILDALERFDCKYSELPEYIADDLGVEGTVGCSNDIDWVTIDGDDWAFELVSCGQHDTRGEMVEFIDQAAYDELHELWDEHHLHTLTEDKARKIHAACDSILDRLYDGMGKRSVEDWAADFIKRHINEFDTPAY